MALNKQDLINGFCKAGINKGDEIEVHSSLSSFGYVDGGDNGSIFIPALRLSPELPLTEEDKKAGITSKIKILPENRTHSAMGIIADTFRMMPDTVTGDGIFAVSGWGRNANEAGEPPVKPWYSIQAQAYEKGLIREGYIGSCKYMCFGIRDVVGLYRQALETDPPGLYDLR